MTFRWVLLYILCAIVWGFFCLTFVYFLVYLMLSLFILNLFFGLNENNLCFINFMYSAGSCIFIVVSFLLLDSFFGCVTLTLKIYLKKLFFSKLHSTYSLSRSCHLEMIFFQIFWGIIRLIFSNQEGPQMCFENSRWYLNTFHGVKVFFGTKLSPQNRTIQIIIFFNTKHCQKW